MARALGDPQPSSAQYVLTRHKTAVKASSGATITANQPVYLVVLTGHFQTGPVGPAPGRVVTGASATVVLDARTGRDTDFSIGNQRGSIRSLGLVGDLLPYMRGTAHPACSAPDLTVHAAFQGATGSMLGGITATNRSSLACTVPQATTVRLSWHGRPLAVTTEPFPPHWLRRMNPQWARPLTVLVPRGRAQVILQWFNWCGATPWGRNRGLHLTVRFTIAHQSTAVEATTTDLVVPPYCNQKPLAGTGSTLRVSRFVSAT
jgi:hypothetical protein